MKSSHPYGSSQRRLSSRFLTFWAESDNRLWAFTSLGFVATVLATFTNGVISTKKHDVRYWVQTTLQSGYRSAPLHIGPRTFRVYLGEN